MANFKQFVLSYVCDEDGASAAEYAVLVAVVVGIVLVAVNQYDLNTIFTTVSNKVTNCVNAAAGATGC